MLRDARLPEHNKRIPSIFIPTTEVSEILMILGGNCTACRVRMRGLCLVLVQPPEIASWKVLNRALQLLLHVFSLSERDEDDGLFC